jgi:hypothetical protein
LTALGEDTTSVLESMKEKMPELIDSYEDLAESVGYSVEKIRELEIAGRTALLTGNFDEFNKLKDEIDKELADYEVISAKSGSTNASTKLAAGM